jgi:hypothetical protein
MNILKRLFPLFFLFLISPSFAFADLNNGLVAVYKFENTGTYNYQDNLISGGTALTFTTGATFPTGGANSTYFLIDSYNSSGGIYGYNNDNLGIDGTSITISCWIKPLSTPNVGEIHSYCSHGSGSTFVADNIWYADLGTGPVIWFLRQRQDVANDGAFYHVTLTNNVWYHLVYTYDSVNSILDGYIDNTLVVHNTGISGNGSGRVSNTTCIGSAPDPYGTCSYYNPSGSIDEAYYYNRYINSTEVSQLYTSFYPFVGGGTSTTTTIDATFSTSTLLDVTGAFHMGSTTLSFGAIDFGACDVNSINLNPFASSSLSWGTFSIPSCFVQSVKFLLFGLDGFDTYRITNFINTSSSTLPFLTFKFIAGTLVYINPVTGELINLPSNATTSLNFSIPLFGTSTAQMFNIPIEASSTFLSGIHVPVVMDQTMATIEFIVFAVMWGTLFRYINI